MVSSWLPPSLLHRFSTGDMDRPADTAVGAAAAEIATHGAVDICVRRLRLLLQQGHGRHDLPRLAVAALGNILCQPSPHDRVPLRNTLDGNDLLALHIPHRGYARTLRRSLNMNRAGTTQTFAATELGADQPQLFPQHPQKWRI